MLQAAGASAPGTRSEPLRREVGAVAPGGRRHCCGWQGRCARRVVGAAALGGPAGAAASGGKSRCAGAAGAAVVPG